MQHTVEKTTIECYKIRSKDPDNWADISIDSNGTSGRISIASDFGSYQYYWGACGVPFKEFLYKLNIEYAADKFGASRWFDLDATIKMYKSNIIEQRRRDYMDKEQARKIYNEIKQIEEISANNVESFVHEANQHKSFMEEWNYCPETCYSINPQFKMFWNRIWIIFINQLKEEIK